MVLDGAGGCWTLSARVLPVRLDQSADLDIRLSRSGPRFVFENVADGLVRDCSKVTAVITEKTKLAFELSPRESRSAKVATSIGLGGYGELMPA